MSRGMLIGELVGHRPAPQSVVSTGTVSSVLAQYSTPVHRARRFIAVLHVGAALRTAVDVSGGGSGESPATVPLRMIKEVVSYAIKEW